MENSEELIDESILLEISQDMMKVTIEFFPASGGRKIKKENIYKELERKNIIFGIKSELIEELIIKREYNKKYIIVEGKSYIEGKDGQIDFKFPTDIKINPQIKEDGGVDYHNLNLYHNVEQGEVLVVKIDKTNGEIGTNVLGEPINPPAVKDAILPKCGKNVELSSDGYKIISNMEGQVEFKKNVISIIETLTISGDVGNSTGNIVYSGSVVVQGNVLTGFSIKAKKNIEVRGIVEGATLISGGDIILRKGVQGMDKARIICNGDLNCRNIYTAFVKANGSIKTEEIMHSNVTSNNEIIVDGKKGLISGGKVRAYKKVEAKNIGANIGTKTIVEVGVDPDTFKKYQEFKKSIKDGKVELDKIKKIIELLEHKEKQGLLTDSKKEMLKKSKSTFVQIELKLKEDKVKLDVVTPLVMNDNNGKVRASNTIKVGTIVTIGTMAYVVENELDRCSLVKEGSDIRVGSY